MSATTMTPIRFTRTDHDGAEETLTLVTLPEGKKLYCADLGRETPYAVLVEQGDHYTYLHDLDGVRFPSHIAVARDCTPAATAPDDVIYQIETGWATGLMKVERIP